MSTISRASLDQEIYLRSLTGYLVGRHMLSGFRRVAVLAYPDRICSAMAAAALASYEASGNYRDAAGAVFLLEQGKEDAAARGAVGYGADAVYLSLGGEQRMSDVASMTARALGALARAGYRGALLLHVRAWLATKQLSTVLPDASLASYLGGLDLRVFTADAGARKFYFNRVRV
ncbi:MAG: hypothetical protein ACP5NG_02840, partial [Conexivisphaera sp.]